MTLTTRLEVQGFTLTPVERHRIDHHLTTLDHQALAHRSAPRAVLVLRRHAAQRRIEANLQVQLGSLGAHVVSHQTAGTVDQAVRLAVADVERQLERRLVRQRGEPSFGVPSRREPAALRPHPPREPTTTAGAPTADEKAPATDEE